MLQLRSKKFIDCPEVLPFVAEQLFNQWFSSRPGCTLERLLAQMQLGKGDAIPLGLVAFVDGEPAGTVSLLDKDLRNAKTSVRGSLGSWCFRSIASEALRELL